MRIIVISMMKSKANFTESIRVETQRHVRAWLGFSLRPSPSSVLPTIYNKKNILYIFPCHTYHIWCFFFLLVDPYFHLVSFSFCLITSFNTFCSDVLLVIHTFSFHVSSFFKIYFYLYFKKY